MIPRDKMLLFTAGHFISRTDTWGDMIITMDNFLIFQNLPPMTEEERHILNEVYDEIWVIMKQNLVNRGDIRNMWKGKK